MKFSEITNDLGSYIFMCPGCGYAHKINTKEGKGEPVWGFNGNLEFPSVTPSIRVQWTEGEDHIQHCCHSFITDGNIQFLSDCTHSLAGKTVSLDEI